MKFEIKHYLSGSIIFSLETDSFKLCVEAAVKARAYLTGAYLTGADLRGADLRGAYLRGADLTGAYLTGAYLTGADLRGAYLRGADLTGADLTGAKIRGDITITKEPIHLSGLTWLVTIWDKHMQIGCELHTHDEWRGFSDDDWLRMGSKEALKMKREQFPMLIGLCDNHAKGIVK